MPTSPSHSDADHCASTVLTMTMITLPAFNSHPLYIHYLVICDVFYISKIHLFIFLYLILKWNDWEPDWHRVGQTGAESDSLGAQLSTVKWCCS